MTGKASEPTTKSWQAKVWRMLESVPGFREGMARAEEDFRSGRAHRFRHRPHGRDGGTPND